MNLIFVGPQGSGKGTQAKIISEKLNLDHISTGDLLRNIEGDIKKKVDKYVNKGLLIPDDLMLEILKKQLSENFILDGFPRNLKQAEMLSSIIDIDKVVEIFISDKEAIKRLSGRRTCKKCGAIYNIYTNPPKKDVCDKCGGELIKRKDDNEEAIKKRLEIYHSETEPILEKYPVLKINGEQEIEKVTKDILKGLK